MKWNIYILLTPKNILENFTKAKPHAIILMCEWLLIIMSDTDWIHLNTYDMSITHIICEVKEKSFDKVDYVS